MAPRNDPFAPLNQIDRTLPVTSVTEETLFPEEKRTAEEGERTRTELPNGYYEVEAIRRKRLIKGKKQYVIKWYRQDYPEAANRWEPLADLQGVSNMIDAFEERFVKRKHKGTLLRKRLQPSTTASITDDGHPIVEIIKPKYCALPRNNKEEAFFTFLAFKSNGAKVVVSNKSLKASNPLLLINSL